MHWKNYTSLPEQFRKHRVFDGCGVAGFLNIDGKLEDGTKITNMITILQDRENGLGAGFAAYGIYPKYKEHYALHFLFDDEHVKVKVLEYLAEIGFVVQSEAIPTIVPPNVDNPPITWRVFFDPNEMKSVSDDEQIIQLVMNINQNFEGAFVMSSGKNMGVFKGNGWSHEIAKFYKIKDYKACMWLAHSRFPTNTPGWWGGAHPFNLLNTSVVHNGEITSYGTNMRYLESFGYKCTLRTDTEVIAYLFDLLARKHQIPIEIVDLALSPPLFQDINKLKKEHQIAIKNIRATYRSAMLNGPFSIIVGFADPIPAIIGLTDRKKLRPLVAGISEDENTVYMSSEEASFKRLMLNPNINFALKKLWHPNSGAAVIATLGKGLIRDGLEKPFEITILASKGE